MTDKSFKLVNILSGIYFFTLNFFSQLLECEFIAFHFWYHLRLNSREIIFSYIYCWGTHSLFLMFSDEFSTIRVFFLSFSLILRLRSWRKGMKWEWPALGDSLLRSYLLCRVCLFWASHALGDTNGLCSLLLWPRDYDSNTDVRCTLWT